MLSCLRTFVLRLKYWGKLDLHAFISAKCKTIRNTNPQPQFVVSVLHIVCISVLMAFVFGFSRDVTELINSYWDLRYRMVRGGGQTPSASAMPLPIPPHHGFLPVTANMKHKQYYIQRLESRYIEPPHAPCDRVNINIWEGYTCKRSWNGSPRRAVRPIKSFACSSKDVCPCDLAALCSTCDACEPYSLQLERTRV